VVSPSELSARRARGQPSSACPFSCGLLLDSFFSLQCVLGCFSLPHVGLRWFLWFAPGVHVLCYFFVVRGCLRHREASRLILASFPLFRGIVVLSVGCVDQWIYRRGGALQALRLACPSVPVFSRVTPPGVIALLMLFSTVPAVGFAYYVGAVGEYVFEADG